MVEYCHFNNLDLSTHSLGWRTIVWIRWADCPVFKQIKCSKLRFAIITPWHNSACTCDVQSEWDTDENFWWTFTAIIMCFGEWNVKSFKHFLRSVIQRYTFIKMCLQCCVMFEDIPTHSWCACQASEVRQAEMGTEILSKVQREERCFQLKISRSSHNLI